MLEWNVRLKFGGSCVSVGKEQPQLSATAASAQPHVERPRSLFVFLD